MVRHQIRADMVGVGWGGVVDKNALYLYLIFTEVC